jgi:Ice-binding-like
LKRLDRVLAVLVTSAVVGLSGTMVALAASPAPVDLGTAANFVILSKSGVTTTGVTKITGNVGVSPIAASGLTGFGLVLDSSGTFARSTLVTGKVYAADYSAPTPSMLTTAVGDMEAAYTDAAGRAPTSAATTDVGAGNIGGLTLTPGVYKWSTGVTIPTNVTLSGGKNDVWIFQIAGTLNISSGKNVVLKGGAQAKNIFWQVAGATTLGTNSKFNGNILGQTNIAVQTGAVLNGRALAQTAVTLDANAVSVPPGTKNR